MAPRRRAIGSLRAGRWLAAPLLAAVAVAAAPCAAEQVASGGPAVRPINGRIVFTAGPGSDLFTIRPDGRGLRRLTSGAGWDGEPVWSPDGRWIAFNRQAGDGGQTSVYVVAGAGGRPRLVLRGARSPRWSPSGRRLAVLRSGASCANGGCPGAHDVWTVPVAGGKPRLALAGGWAAAWSPSAREQLAVARSDGIWIVTVASGAVRKLSTVSGARGAPLDWSPDGSRLVLALEDNSIRTVSTSDGSLTTLVPPSAPAVPPACSTSIWGPIWSPDGRLIAYQQSESCVPSGGVPRDSLSIRVIAADGTSVDGISTRDSVYDLGAWWFAWSPDSTALAFIDDKQGSNGDLILTTSSLLKASIHHLNRNADLDTPDWQRVTASP
jgi:Tol biopolymer transport system component